jgi:hypothetical protein
MTMRRGNQAVGSDAPLLKAADADLVTSASWPASLAFATGKMETEHSVNVQIATIVKIFCERVIFIVVSIAFQPCAAGRFCAITCLITALTEATESPLDRVPEITFSVENPSSSFG